MIAPVGLKEKELSPDEIQDLVVRTAENLGIEQGLPLGIGQDIVTTNNPALNDLLDSLKFNVFEVDNVEDWVSLIAENPQEFPGYIRSFQTTESWKGGPGLVIVYRCEETKKVYKAFFPEERYRTRMHFIANTALCRSKYNPVKAEEAARERLKEALTEEEWNSYVLSDAFDIVGKSGVTYVLRKNRPTIAFRNGKNLLCALCLHPYAYYQNTWAGAMPPSDEVLAHLLFIKADEHGFWKRANQIPLGQIESGL